MNKLLSLSVAAATALTLGAGIAVPAFAKGEPNQICGSAVGRALARLDSAIFKEASRACGKGTTVDPARLAKATGRYNDSIGANSDPGSCPAAAQAVEASVVDEASTLAANLCTPGATVP